MIIRNATIEDAPQIVHMTERFLASSLYGQFFAFDPGKALALVSLVLERGAVFLAEQDGYVIGMLAVAEVPHHISGEPYAEEIAWWVDEEYRGSLRAGPALLKRFEAFAQARGLSMAKLGAPANRPEVGAYYERLGYQPVEVIYAKRF